MDTLAATKKLQAAGVNPDHADAIASLISDRHETAVTSTYLAMALKDLELQLTLRLGAIQIAIAGVLFAALKLI